MTWHRTAPIFGGTRIGREAREMLGIGVDKVEQIIQLARELDRAEPEFDAFVERLDEDEQAHLVAMMWVGRGSFEPEDFKEAVQIAYSEATTPTADYLKGSPHMSDHLESALDLLTPDDDDEEDED
jgi:hypothetical protein